MYFNKFSSGTILALLALSGMLVLVPLAAPVHATNGSPLQLSLYNGDGAPLAGDHGDNYIVISVTNPASNQYAVTGLTLAFSMPGFTASSWEVWDCDYTGGVFTTCSVSYANTVSFTSSSLTDTGIPPGTTAFVEVWLYTPTDNVGTVFPLTTTVTTTVQDGSSASYYGGPTFGIQTISPASEIAYTLTPGGSNTVTSFTA